MIRSSMPAPTATRACPTTCACTSSRSAATWDSWRATVSVGAAGSTARSCTTLRSSSALRAATSLLGSVPRPAQRLDQADAGGVPQVVELDHGALVIELGSLGLDELEVLAVPGLVARLR